MKYITASTAVAVLLAMSASSVLAEEPQEAPKQEKKICRTEKMTGSLTRSRRICLTAAEWRELTIRTKKGVDEMQGSASGGLRIENNSGPGGL